MRPVEGGAEPGGLDAPAARQQLGEARVGHRVVEQRRRQQVVGQRGAVGALVRREVAQAVHLLAAELLPVVHAGQGVALAVGGHRQQAADAGKVEVPLGVRRGRVAEERGQPLHARTADAVPVVVGQRHAYVRLGQRAAHRARHRVGAEDQHAARLRLGHLQPQRQRPRGGALQHHGADDQDEHQRHQHFGAGHAQRLQAQREQRGDRGRHDAARRHPGDQRALAPAQRAAEAGDQHGERSYHELREQEDREARPQQMPGQRPGQPRRQQDEQQRHQQRGEVLLEIEDVVDVHAAHVAQRDAHDRHREQARLVRDRVGAGEGQQHRGQRAVVLQVFGNQLAPQQEAQQQRGQRAGQRAAAHRGGEHAEGVSLLVRHHRLVDQHREQRAQRIDHDAFPAQRVGDARVRPQRAQHRRNHGRARDAAQRTEQQGDRPRQAGHQMRGQCQQQQRGHRAVTDQPAHGLADAGQFVETQGQAAFEQDQRHRQRHGGKQQIAQQPVRIEHAGGRPERDAGQQQEQDRR